MAGAGLSEDNPVDISTLKGRGGMVTFGLAGAFLATSGSREICGGLTEIVSDLERITISRPLLAVKTLVPEPSEAVMALSVKTRFPVPVPLTLKLIFIICKDFPVKPEVDPPTKETSPLLLSKPGSTSQKVKIESVLSTFLTSKMSLLYLRVAWAALMPTSSLSIAIIALNSVPTVRPSLSIVVLKVAA